MKIIRHGDPKRTKPDIEFECRCCGCIFIAEYGEYQKFNSQKDGSWMEAICPECNRKIYKKSLIRRNNY